MRKFILVPAFFLVSLLNSSSVCAATTGITYKKYTPDNFSTIHVVTVDPTKFKIIAARAQDVGAGLESVTTIGQHYAALVAINGGFFRLNDPESPVGVPAGVLRINNHWYGIAYQPRGAIGWDPRTNKVLMDRLQTKSNLTINNNNFRISAMNKNARINKGYLLTDSFAMQVDEVAPYTAIAFSDNKVRNKVEYGSIVIPKNGYVYLVDANSNRNIATIKKGDTVKLSINVLPQFNPQQAAAWEQMPYIIGGGPLLINNNRIISSFNAEKQRDDFINKKHARTAIGVLPNKNWVMVVVEQQLLTENTGMTIAELAKFIHGLGCVQALNLDGGGSSSMYVAPQLNANTSNLSRPVSDAILVVAK